MNINYIMLVLNTIFGGITGVVKYLLNLFNTQVLARITNKEEAQKYVKDVRAFSVFLNAIIENHGDSMSEGKRDAANAVIAAVDTLAKALEDFTIDETEFDEIIQAVKDAVSKWKKAK